MLGDIVTILIRLVLVVALAMLIAVRLLGRSQRANEGPQGDTLENEGEKMRNRDNGKHNKNSFNQFNSTSGAKSASQQAVIDMLRRAGMQDKADAILENNKAEIERQQRAEIESEEAAKREVKNNTLERKTQDGAIGTVALNVLMEYLLSVNGAYGGKMGEGLQHWLTENTKKCLQAEIDSNLNKATNTRWLDIAVITNVLVMDDIETGGEVHTTCLVTFMAYEYELDSLNKGIVVGSPEITIPYKANIKFVRQKSTESIAKQIREMKVENINIGIDKK